VRTLPALPVPLPRSPCPRAPHRPSAPPPPDTLLAPLVSRGGTLHHPLPSWAEPGPHCLRTAPGIVRAGRSNPRCPRSSSTLAPAERPDIERSSRIQSPIRVMRDAARSVAGGLSLHDVRRPEARRVRRQVVGLPLRLPFGLHPLLVVLHLALDLCRVPAQHRGHQFG